MITQEVNFPTFQERINATVEANSKHNAQAYAKANALGYVPSRADLKTEDPQKIERAMLKRMMGKGIGRSQNKRRKLIRQNPHLLRSKKY